MNEREPFSAPCNALQSSASPVWSFNEWDPLEEVIVGIVDGAMVPELDRAVNAIVPDHAKWFFEKYGGTAFPSELIQAAAEELDNLARVLTRLGIVVRRPEALPFSEISRTPWWESRGLYAAMPRDVYMVVGDILVEAPMAWRSRYFESFAYHPLMQGYFQQGARWLAAPKPTMADGFYDNQYDPREPDKNGEKQFVITNKEIAFDAADFVRCGRDIFGQRSNVTNRLGIEWVRRHIGQEFTVHEVEFGDAHPMHIDTTIVPLAPGKILVNPGWVKELPPIFKSWEVLVAPAPTHLEDSALYFSSDWLSINTLSIDEKRVVVEEKEYALIDSLIKWGFEPVPVPFRNFYSFGGSVHCATLDVRRRGKLQSYF